LPRDLAEIAGGLLAAGAHSATLRIIDYLQSTQEGDRHWPQNMWLDVTHSALWQSCNKRRTIPSEVVLRIGLRSAASILWWVYDNNKTSKISTHDTRLNFNIVEIPTQALPIGTRVCITISSTDLKEGTPSQFQVVIEK